MDETKERQKFDSDIDRAYVRHVEQLHARMIDAHRNLDVAHDRYRWAREAYIRAALGAK